MQVKLKFIQALTALTLRTTPVEQGDTLLDAFGKLQGQIDDRVDLGSTQTISGSKTFTANTVFSGDIAVNGGDITTTATTFNVATSATTLQIGAGAGTLRLGSFAGIGTSGNANTILNLSGTFTGDAARQGINQSVTINSEPLTAARSYRGHSAVISNLVTNADKGATVITLDGVIYTAQNGTVDNTQDVSATTVTGGRFIGTERSASTVSIPAVTGVQGNTSHRGSATTVDSFGARAFVVTESVFTGTINNAHGYFGQVVNNAGTIDTAYGVRNLFSGPVAIPQIIGFFNDLSGVQTTTLDFAAEAGQTLKIGHWNTASKVAQVDLTIAADGSTALTTNSSSPALRITQTGTGEAIRVEDETSSDATPFVVATDGKVGIGNAATSANINVNISKPITGATNHLNIYAQPSVLSDVTSSANVYYSNPSTQAATFTLNQLKHFTVDQGTIGAGSTVNNQYGFFVEGSDFTGATNNFAFFSSLAAATGRWNLYMQGNASNHLSGKLLVGTTVENDYRLHISDASGKMATFAGPTGGLSIEDFGGSVVGFTTGTDDSLSLRANNNQGVLIAPNGQVTLSVASSPNLKTPDLEFTGTNSPVHAHAGGIQGTLANNTLYRVGTFTPQLDGQHSTIEGAIHLGSNVGVRTFRFQAQCRRNTSATQVVNAFLSVDTDELDGIRDFGQFEFYLENTLPSTKFVVAFRTGALGTNVLSTHWNVLIHDRSTKSLWEQVSTNTIFDPTGYTLLAPNMDNRTSSQKLTAPEFIGPLTGNASTASKLQQPKSISLVGDVSGVVDFDGSSDIQIQTLIAEKGGFTPTKILSTEEFVVPENKQAFFKKRIRIAAGGRLVVRGDLIQVS